MHISPQAQQALIELARCGLWLQVDLDKLQVIATCEDRGLITDALRFQLASKRAELLQVIPGLESDHLALTGPVVRVLFARLPPDQQRRPRITRAEFSTQYDDLTISERVAFLWWLMDGPVKERNQRLKGVAA